ncbi:MAG: hypothetical protein KF850_33140 [Labilithrix sp.]|nr:hypothetical protein [Labilithrix sp.]MBX3216925.1 hypothetical protein [Labilithrix sp.]
MSRLEQCPGCGRPTACACAPADVRAQLARERAELSDRAAATTARANEAARLLRELARIARDVSRYDLAEAAERWLAPGSEPRETGP